MFSFFKKKKKDEKKPYKGIPTGISRGFRFNSIIGYYCTNCYYGTHSYEDGLKEYKDKRCPKCDALLNWDEFDDEKY